MDAESNNLRIAVSDSNAVYNQYGYGALSGSDSAYVSHPDDDEVTIFVAVEDTINEPTINMINMVLTNVKEATMTFYDENHEQIYQIVRILLIFTIKCHVSTFKKYICQKTLRKLGHAIYRDF